LLGLAVVFWVAGFDLIYACQDVDYDRSRRLRSLPARFGVRAALLVSLAFHVLAVATLVVLWRVALLGVPALLGVAVVASLLAYSHAIVTTLAFSRVNVVFFNVNGFIGLVLLAAVALDLYW